MFDQNCFQDSILSLRRFAMLHKESQIQSKVLEWAREAGCLDALQDGARFGDKRTWWGSRSLRPNPHEGIDFLLPEECPVFPVYEGVLLGIIPHAMNAADVKRGYDYLGSTVIMGHRIMNEDSRMLVSLYGHMNPNPETNGPIGRVSKSPRSDVPSHLHLSLGWLKSKEKITSWNEVSCEATSSIHLFDPLPASFLK